MEGSIPRENIRPGARKHTDRRRGGGTPHGEDQNTTIAKMRMGHGSIGNQTSCHYAHLRIRIVLRRFPAAKALTNSSSGTPLRVCNLRNWFFRYGEVRCRSETYASRSFATPYRKRSTAR